MSKTESSLQFSAISRSVELWKSVSSAIMTIVDEAHFEATPEGLKFRSMDPSHIALIDIEAPAAAFEKYDCPSVIKFGVRVSEFAKIIKRAGANDSIDVGIEDNWLVIKTSGGYARNYKMRLIETAGSTTPLPKLAFDSKLVMAPSILDRILSDVTVVSDNLTIETTTTTTNDKVALFSGKGDSGEAKVTIDERSGIENLHEISIGAASKASYSAEFISKIVKAIGASSQLVTMEYSSSKPLKMAFALPNAVKIEFFMAPRVQD